MRYLFVHQNFPGQYRHLARFLADHSDNEVCFLTQHNENHMKNVRKMVYPAAPNSARHCHPYTVDIDRAIQTGTNVATECAQLAASGFIPDIIIGHSGWGETLFVKDVFPDVPLLANFEFFYHAEGADVGFDPEFSSIFNNPSRLRARNATNLMAFDAADWGHSATRWQRSLMPSYMQPRITAIHEGVDTQLVRPNPDAQFTIPNTEKILTRRDEVITYVARNLEPYRGFHIFMRALPGILKRRKHAQVVIVGGDSVSYGAPPPPRSNFREMMLQEVGDRLDLQRVHFVGQLEYGDYLSLLQVSSAHVYLTYPFVLSWSFIEAMACGCLMIGSATPPVLEVMRHGVNGISVDFFDIEALTARLCDVLASPTRADPLRQAARATAVQQFDLHRQLLPRWNRLLDDLIHRRPPSLGLAA